MKVEDIIQELTEIILMQEKELNELNNKINRINQYLDVYEEFIKGEE